MASIDLLPPLAFRLLTGRRATVTARALVRPQCAWILILALAGCGTGSAGSQSAAGTTADGAGSLDLQAAFLAKSLCTGLWVNGRQREEFLATDILIGADAIEAAKLAVDDQHHTVTAEVGGEVHSRAVFHPGHGCTLLPADVEEVGFDPISIDPAPTEAALGFDPFANPTLSAQQRAAFDLAASQAFTAQPGVRTRALVALHQGHLIAEQYDTEHGFGPESVNLSWSMGKSIASALVGALVHRGWLRVHEQGLLPDWKAEGDPRAAITVLDLLQMSSGLAFDRIEAGEPGFFSRANHHFMVYFGVLDVVGYVTRFPLRSTPGTVGLYRNSDPLSLIAIVRERVQAHGEEFLTFPQRALFDRIGATSFVLERDARGNPIISGYDHATARDWARFGLLHLNDGTWNGERILPQGWAALVSSPAPAWVQGGYGGLFWRNDPGSPGGRFPSLPAEAYYAAGAFGQFTIIVPEHELVVVRMGYDSNGAAATSALDRAIAAILEQLARL